MTYARYRGHQDVLIQQQDLAQVLSTMAMKSPVSLNPVRPAHPVKREDQRWTF